MRVSADGRFDLLKSRFDAVVTAQIGEISYHMLKNSFVDVLQAKADSKVSEKSLSGTEIKNSCLYKPRPIPLMNPW